MRSGSRRSASLEELDGGAGVDSPPCAEVDAALGQLVEDGYVLGDADGVPVGDDGAALADTHPVAFGDEVSADEDGVGRGTVPAVPGEMVLGEPETGKASLVHESDLFPHLADQGVPGIVLADVIVGCAVESHRLGESGHNLGSGQVEGVHHLLKGEQGDV